MKALKAYFLSLQTRERILVASLCVIAAVVVLSLFTKKATVFWRKESALMTRINGQNVVIASRDVVEKRARDASSKLVPGLSLSQVQLQSSVNQTARDAGIMGNSLQISNLPDTNVAGSNLALHSIRLSFSGVAWAPLGAFYTALEKRRPYITIEEMTVTVPDQRTGLHAVQMKLSSIEVKQ